ncbi:MAG: replication-associated recombination protein A [Bacteroidales bacterium]|jgi:putative ATPase|nr:replication-associated recombination protein A [Bacteroidales bacterium]
MDNRPLPEILRPESIDDFVGQEKLMGKDGIIRKMLENNTISSMIFWGPPGVGKTTLALIIAKSLNRKFYQLSAINSGVKEVREVISEAQKEKSPILFIDEIHRFSKSQQDSLLSAVEKGIVTLIGATTENPSFEIISPLLSRCQVYVLEALSIKELDILVEKAVAYFKNKEIDINILEKDALYRFSGGDARKFYNLIKLVVENNLKNNSVEITNAKVAEIIQKNIARFDKTGELHYDIISAFIKSIRGSDPNAALYWLARMISAGEDHLFIARRMIILAAEDVGLANPNAILLANTCFDAVHKIGYPESRIILAQCAVYLANSPKSNASYMGIDAAIENVNKTGDLPVPLHLRNAPTKLMKELDYGKNYKYAHDFENNFVEQEFLPDKIKGTKFYEPAQNPRENEHRKFLKVRWKNKYNY